MPGVPRNQIVQSHTESHERASAGNSEDKIKLALFQRSARILELGNSSKNQLHLTMRNDCLFLLSFSKNEFSNQTSQFRVIYHLKKIKKLTISPSVGKYQSRHKSHSREFSRDLFSSRSLSLKIIIWVSSGCLRLRKIFSVSS